MENRICKDTGERVSLLGFGCMRFPMLSKELQDIDEEKAFVMIDLAYKSGVNYFDTAYIYHNGLSEKFMGKALSKYPRDSYKIATKMPPWPVKTKDDVRRIFDEQLENCKVDYFDFYLVHNFSSLTKNTIEQCEFYEFLTQKKEEGKIKRLGFSFHDTPEVLEEIAGKYKWDFAQIQLNYLDWEMQNAKRQYEILADKGIPVIVMEPVRGGALASLSDEAAAIFKEADANASVASWAIRFAASLPNVLTVLSGMSTVEQINDNIKTMTDFMPLSKQEYDVIEKALSAYRSSCTIPCTACRYCMDCPSGVDIPNVFSTYNQFKMHKSQWTFNENYHVLGKEKQAHNCTECGKCMEHCPQSIDIPARLKEVAAEAGVN